MEKMFSKAMETKPGLLSCELGHGAVGLRHKFYCFYHNRRE